MEEKEYVIGAHFIAKSLADVDYPILKKQLINKVGSRKVKVGWNEEKTMEELIEPVNCERFETAASLFNSLVAKS